MTPVVWHSAPPQSRRRAPASSQLRTRGALDYESCAAYVVAVAPGAGGRGLSLSVEPVWGSAGSGMQALWQHGASGLAAAPGSGGRVGAELGYGLAAEQLLVLHGRVAVE